MDAVDIAQWITIVLVALGSGGAHVYDRKKLEAKTADTLFKVGEDLTKDTYGATERLANAVTNHISARQPHGR